MDRVRGGVFSGAMVLAGISATLLSALLAIGIRQVTALHENRPVQVSLVPSSGQVAVPDATTSPKSSHAAPTPSFAPAYAPVPHSYMPPSYVRHSSVPSAPTSGTTTGSRSGGGSVTKPAPVATTTTKPASAAPSSTPTPTPTPSKPGQGHANGAGNGNGSGNGSGNGNGHNH